MTESVSQPEDGLRHIEQLYRVSENGTILLYAGDFQLSDSQSAWHAAGNLELRLGPRSTLRARFAGSDPWMIDSILADGYPTVEIPAGALIEPPEASALPTPPDEVLAWTDYEIPVNHIEVGDVTTAERVILHIVGRLVDYPLPRYSTDHGEQERLSFVLPGWSLCLVKASRETESEADFTYVIEATPHRLPFRNDDVQVLTRRLFFLLRFAASGGIGVGPRVGLDKTGKVVWAEWGNPRMEASGPRWCPDHLVREALPILADGLQSVAADPGLEACIDRAISLLLAANEDAVLDVKIPMACSGLELVGWAVLQHRQWLTPDQLDRLSAGSRTRLLLQWAGIPIDLPPDSNALRARRGRDGKPFLAGPELIFEVRNKVVHPPKKLSDPEWPGPDELFEAWQLATWYLELAIMRALGYNGQYAKRLQLTGWAGQTEAVPWQQ
jgi:hypothetical protein